MNEARDIEEFGGFRSRSVGAFEAGTWFATTYRVAVRWGRSMPPFTRARSFRIASVRVSATRLATVEFRVRLDGIGHAYFMPNDRLRAMNETGSVPPCAAGVELLDADELLPGATGEVRLYPVAPELWMHIQPGTTLEMTEGPSHTVGVATVIRFVPALTPVR
jgi:hypothetical protein